MARGSSGRIVIDVTPEFKDELYTALGKENKTLKEWFLDKANRFCDESRQPSLFIAAEDQATYSSKDSSN
ncbi:hypothetical protein F7C95_05650 [Opitutia bacterium ISCC 51]|nr:hypothetical protein F7C95_05650 [Opitutae bacterium ISCC 51]QXD29450.1 hypothetical protein GA003_05620 [Opitutae bacterium ISCC 52]